MFDVKTRVFYNFIILEKKICTICPETSINFIGVQSEAEVFAFEDSNRDRMVDGSKPTTTSNCKYGALYLDPTAIYFTMLLYRFAAVIFRLPTRYSTFHNKMVFHFET